MALSGRTFLVECYLPGLAERDVAVASERARQAAEGLRRSGREVAYLGALFVAADEAVFHQFRAADPAVVVEASRIAELAFERVVESIDVGGRPPIAGSAGKPIHGKALVVDGRPASMASTESTPSRGRRHEQRRKGSER